MCKTNIKYFLMSLKNASERNYLQINDNMIVNEQYIRWIEKIDDCMEICSRFNGCSTNKMDKTTISLCKVDNPNLYDKLNVHFTNIKKS